YLKAENQILRARITGQIHFIRVPGNQLRLLQAEMRILSWQFKIIAFCMVKEILVYIFTLNRLCFPSALRQTSAIGLGDRLF
uniref:hypothetical protein n=1 Tax=uncultured Rubinisphaera sp. TaxID=1678686 RepID=UPI0030DC707A